MPEVDSDSEMGHAPEGQPEKSSPAHRRSMPGILIVFPYLLVGFLQFLLLYPLHRTMDLPKWDEALTMGLGAQFAHGGTLGPLGWSPLSALLYSVFVKGFGPVDSIFWMQYLMKIGVSLALLFFLLSHLRSRLLAMLLTFIWVISGTNVWEIILSYYLALGLFLIAMAIIRKYPLVSLMLLCLCTLTRLEYLFPTIGFALYILWTHRIPKPTRAAAQYTTASLLCWLALYVMFHIGDFNLGGQREWFAFNQNYGRAQVEAGRFKVDPSADVYLIVQADFPGAHSLRDALRINSRLFALHLAGNVVKLPKQIVYFLKPYVLRPYTNRRALPLVFSVMYGALAIFVVAAIALAPIQKRFLSKLLDSMKNQRIMVFATLISLAALAPIVAVYPMPRHAMIMVPFVLFWPGFVCLEILKEVQFRGFSQCALIALNLIFAAGIVLAQKPYAAEKQPRQVLAEVKWLDEIWPQGKMKFLGSGSQWYASYLGPQRVDFIEPLPTLPVLDGGKLVSGTGDLSTLIKRYDPDVVLMNDLLRSSRTFNADAFSALNSGTWVKCEFGSDRFYLRGGSFPNQGAANCSNEGFTDY